MEFFTMEEVASKESEGLITLVISPLIISMLMIVMLNKKIHNSLTGYQGEIGRS